MPETCTDSLLDVGIDYVTATKHRGAATSNLYTFGRWLVSQEVAGGCKENCYRAQGYRGVAAGRCAVGLSAQGTIVRISSALAKEHWQECFSLSDNITRLDVQATIRGNDTPATRISSHHKELKRAKRGRGKAVQFATRYGPRGAESCSIGNRLSDRYGRVYDKGLESGEEAFDNAVRYELELHRGSAMKTITQLEASRDYQLSMLELLHLFFNDRGLVVPELSTLNRLPQLARVRLSSFPLSVECGTRAPELTRAARFMRNNVRPSVQRFVRAGQLELVLQELGIDHLVQIVADRHARDGLTH